MLKVRGTHSLDKIAHLLQKIHLEFDLLLDFKKIVATINNASDFVKAFRQFGVKLNHFSCDTEISKDEKPKSYFIRRTIPRLKLFSFVHLSSPFTFLQVKVKSTQVELGWVRLGRLSWVGLGWDGFGWVRLGSVGLGWVRLG
ncbi:hypothetical protein ALC56_01082 [Trachymyrmex septentrionalis]|uniref:Uncharacterized protein n=1 Tax=Trachymyrmex septentrionalis TaxID=34720 RepID=A0A195FX08_9HYME|nr:hypothetical protein ALC56_01082 [Trachymyrmex septentrionalis]